VITLSFRHHYRCQGFCVPASKHADGRHSQVCIEFLSLSLVGAGYTVYVNHEASGTFSDRVARESFNRMRLAGVHVVSQFGVTTDLMRDWRNTPGAKELLPYFDECVQNTSFMSQAAHVHTGICPRTGCSRAAILRRRRRDRCSPERKACEWALCALIHSCQSAKSEARPSSVVLPREYHGSGLTVLTLRSACILFLE
jgi:hypothetical protein